MENILKIDKIEKYYGTECSIYFIISSILGVALEFTLLISAMIGVIRKNEEEKYEK